MDEDPQYDHTVFTQSCKGVRPILYHSSITISITTMNYRHFSWLYQLSESLIGSIPDWIPYSSHSCIIHVYISLLWSHSCTIHDYDALLILVTQMEAKNTHCVNTCYGPFTQCKSDYSQCTLILWLICHLQFAGLPSSCKMCRSRCHWIAFMEPWCQPHSSWVAEGKPKLLPAHKKLRLENVLVNLPLVWYVFNGSWHNH